MSTMSLRRITIMLPDQTWKRAGNEPATTATGRLSLPHEYEEGLTFC